jgi:hypothetical protein
MIFACPPWLRAAVPGTSMALSQVPLPHGIRLIPAHHPHPVPLGSFLATGGWPGNNQ